MFKLRKEFPKELLTCEPQDVLDILEAPTLFYFTGTKKPAVFISAFMHGNETTGFYVFQELIRRHGANQWPRDVYFFISNVWAAKEGKRRLDHQPDFNRIWKDGELPENKMAMAVMKAVQPKSLFAVIDIHNNAGRNPHYGIVHGLGETHLNLAALFDKTCLYFSEPDYTCSDAFGHFCPAVTIEAGLPGNLAGITHALEFVDHVMNLKGLPDKSLPDLDLDILSSLGTVLLESRSQVGIKPEAGDICFEKDFDLMNFKLVPAGSVFGYYTGAHRLKFIDDHGRDGTDGFFEHRGGKIMTRHAMVPVMLKTDKHVLKTNCVGYAMLPMDLKQGYLDKKNTKTA